MNKFVYFMAVGLVFTVLQVATVEADHVDTSHCDQFEGDPQAACIAAAESVPSRGESCANEETPALVAACVARNTAAGN